ncbi:MFS transporter, partial [Crocinitomix catalasitica]|nr:MFS transporter [Crocinitomix catalasitica]
PINKIGYKNGIMIGLILSGLGCLLFYPLTPLHSFYLMLLPLFVLGLGFTMLQISCNPYVAILGPKESASSRLNLSQGFNSLGTTICPMFIGFIILTYYQGDSSIQIPYTVLGIVFLVAALFLKFTKLPELNREELKLAGSALKFPHLRFGMFAIFFYVGAEVAIASKLLEYVQLPQIGNVDNLVAPSYVAIYWGGAMIGRLTISVISSTKFNLNKKLLYGFLVSIGTFFVLLCSVSMFMRLELNGVEIRWFEIVSTFKDIWPLLPFLLIQFIVMIIFRNSPKYALGAFSIIGIILLVLAFIMNGTVAMWCIISIGLFNSIMWSNIFTLSIEDLKEYTSQASSLLVIMIVGGAIIPMIMGKISDTFDLPTAYLIPIISYLYIAFFGLLGTTKAKARL